MGITLDSVNKQARLPEDKLDKAWSMLLGWSSKWVYSHQRDLQSLIETLQFASFPWLGLPATHNYPFRKDLHMWHLFLDHWNGISLFLPSYNETSPDIHLYTDAAREIGYGAIL